MIFTVRKGLYRLQHLVMKYASRILNFPVPALLTGSGSVLMLAENIRINGHQHVLVVTDKVLMQLQLLQPFLNTLTEHGILYTIYDEVQPNPTIENVENGRTLYKEAGCDAIVAFGGGSPMDCAKVIGARVVNPVLSVRLMKGLFRVLRSIPPFYCVPTTAGTGSETTIAAVITDAATHEKFAITDPKLIPRMAVLDPELMVGLPRHITSTTGMDALTHAIEAYIGRNGSAVTDDHAERAVQLIFDNLEKVYQDGSDRQARYNMALASFHGGAAFTRAYVGYVHAIAHNMGGLYGVPHGLANAIILPYILDFSRKEAESKLARLAIVGGLGTETESEEDLSVRFIEKIREMNRNMDIPTTISELREEDIPLVVQRALAEAHPDYPVPRIMTRDECEEIVRKLLPAA